MHIFSFGLFKALKTHGSVIILTITNNLFIIIIITKLQLK